MLGDGQQILLQLMNVDMQLATCSAALVCVDRVRFSKDTSGDMIVDINHFTLVSTINCKLYNHED